MTIVNDEYYQELLPILLMEAEELFGKKNKYHYAGLSYHNFPPKVILCEDQLQFGVEAFKVLLNGKGAFQNRTDGIFQLSHEVVHLISPIEQDEGNEVNYLEEGMACYFSKVITERETDDKDFCDQAIHQFPKYQKALILYNELREIDEDAVRKLREVCPIIAKIKPIHFEEAGLDIPANLIENLLEKF